MGKYDREGRLKNKGGVSRPEVSVGRHRGFISSSSGYALRGWYEEGKSGQPACQKSGQFHLLLTSGIYI